MATILMVDDEARMRKLVSDFLKKEGYKVTEAADGEEALDRFYSDGDIDLIILDVMMPKLNGYEVLKEIRESSDVPVIMLTAKAEEADELKGFELGVDEYIGKPFRPKLLVARVGAVLKRAGNDDAGETLEAEGITLDSGAHEVRVDGRVIELSVKEFELMQFFIKNRGIALSREKILESVWDYDYYGDARTIDTHVKKLRAKLGARGDAIKTIWGMGYKFG
ncbi:MAG: response regulator transcription factor [Lachnospiraceae bacterium]|nr:response regulator transcription factor [Lachnospiraceae bacterium]